MTPPESDDQGRWSRFRRPAPDEQRVVPRAVAPRPVHADPREVRGPEAPGAPASPAAARPVDGPWPPAPGAPGAPPVLVPSHRAGTWAPEGQGGHALASPGSRATADAPAPYFEPWSGGEWDDPPRRGEPGPSRPWAVASVVFAVAVAPLGLVFGLVALARARREGSSPVLAVVGIVLACVVAVVSVVWGVAWLDHVVQLAAACRRVGPGDYLTGDGSVVTCS